MRVQPIVLIILSSFGDGLQKACGEAEPEVVANDLDSVSFDHHRREVLEMMGMIEPILEDKARMDEVVELEEDIAKLEAEMLEVKEQSNFHQKNLKGKSSTAPVDVLASAKCEEYMAGTTSLVQEIVSFGEESLKEMFCTDGARRDITSKFEAKLDEMVGDVLFGESDPCHEAFEMIKIQEKKDIFEALSSKETCEVEVKKEIEIVQKGEASERSSFLCGGLCISVAGGVVSSVIPTLFSWWSDRRLKHNVEQIGTSPRGIPIYSFQYRSDVDLAGGNSLDTESIFSGAMAQDLLELVPDAVVYDPFTGYYRVDYTKIDVDFRKI